MSVTPYNLYQGGFVVRTELVTEAPDVVNAIVEALVEAELWLRRNPETGADAMAARPELKSTPREVLAQQIREYNLLYKPTYMYPLGSFWGGAKPGRGDMAVYPRQDQEAPHAARLRSSFSR